MKNKVFEPLFGSKPIPEVLDTQPTPKMPQPPVKPINNASGKNTLGLLQLDESKKKLIWTALVVLLLIVLIYLLSSNKKKKSRKNPKRLISRFKNASKRESLEE